MPSVKSSQRLKGTQSFTLYPFSFMPILSKDATAQWIPSVDERISINADLRAQPWAFRPGGSAQTYTLKHHPLVILKQTYSSPCA